MRPQTRMPISHDCLTCHQDRARIDREFSFLSGHLLGALQMSALKSCCAALVFFAGMLSSTILAQDNWPQFRGADSLGVSTHSNLPERWSATENVAWKTDVPGRGWSSPIVWRDKIFLTTCVHLG